MEFDWKKNWKWIAIGAGILLAIIVIAFLIVFLTGAGGIGIGKGANHISVNKLKKLSVVNSEMTGENFIHINFRLPTSRS